MKYQKGGAGLVFLGVILVLGAGALASYVINANYGNRAEVGLDATMEDNENILAQYSLKVNEVVQVPEMMKDDFKEVYEAAMSGRYGDGGSKAVFQFFKEQNPQLDAALYVKIQQIIEAGRNEFKVAQTRLVDEKRVYVTNLGYVWKGFWLQTAGYPKVNVGYPRGAADDYEVITSEYAIDAFETGVDKGLQLGGQ